MGKQWDYNTTEKEFLDYLEKHDIRIGDCFKNIEVLNRIKRLEASLKKYPSNFDEVEKKYDELENFLASNNFHKRQSKRYLQHSKIHVIGNYLYNKAELERLKKNEEKYKGLVITKFQYIPQKEVTNSNWGRNEPARLEIICANCGNASENILHTVYLGNYYYGSNTNSAEKFIVSDWRRFNRRKKVSKKKQTAIKETNNNQENIIEEPKLDK